MEVALVFPDCAWCRMPCDVPDNTRTQETAEGEELTFCSRSCESAYLNG